MDAQKELKMILKQSKSLPFLFIGSGLSQRYLSTKTWDDLLRYFAKLVKGSDYSFDEYKTIAEKSLIEEGKALTRNNLLPKIADLIEYDFNLKWFQDDSFKENRENSKEYIKEIGFSPFKIEIANHFRAINVNETTDHYKKEIELLKLIGKKSISGIITTNYDTLLESIFPDYTVYVGQEELIFSSTYGIGEIYKIHGCCLKPSSIIINSNDYKTFEERNSYLAAKLMTIFVEHPIIFIGYALDDENIKAIIKSIVDCLSEENLSKLKDRLIFVEWRKGSEMSVIPHSRDFGDGKVINMTKVQTDSFEDLFKIISDNKSRYSTRFFRKLKRDIYELALTSEPSERILVMPFSEDQMEKDDEPEVVIGFGILELGKRGYKGVSAVEIFEDVVFDNKNFSHVRIVEDTLPVLGKNVAWSIPVFKYIKDYKKELPDELKKFENFTFDNLINKTIKQNRQKFQFRSFDEILEKEPNNLKRQVRFLQTLDEDLMDIEKLESYLKETLTKYPDVLKNGEQEAKTGIKKLIRIYDYLKYKK